METPDPYVSDPLLDEEVNEALLKNDPTLIWKMTATLATMDEEEYQIHRAAIKKRMNGSLSVTALDKAVASHRKEEEEEDEDENKLPPNLIANQILEKYDLLNVADNLYVYDGRKWSPVRSSFLNKVALLADGEANTTKNRRSEISSFITAKIYTDQHKWRQINPYEVPVFNGVIDIRTMEMRPHRKEDYLQTCIPWEYNPGAQCPQLMSCLDTYFGKDDDGELKMAALQEFFGYCLMPHARYKKALLCVGESDCGKSTIPFLLRTLLGGENISAVSVEHMDDDRKRAPLLGKLVNLLTELTSEAMIADGGFKTLVSTEEPILFDPKHLAPVMDIPICKHIIVTNKKPRIGDKSNATYNRLLLIHFNHVIPAADQDKAVWDRLKGEIDGILSWALEGAVRIYQKGGKFSDPGSSEIKEYKKEQDHMHAFLSHYCEVDPHSKTPTSVFVDKFKQANSGKWAASTILDMVREKGFEIEENPTSNGLGKKFRHILKLKVN